MFKDLNDLIEVFLVGVSLEELNLSHDGTHENKKSFSKERATSKEKDEGKVMVKSFPFKSVFVLFMNYFNIKANFQSKEKYIWFVLDFC